LRLPHFPAAVSFSAVADQGQNDANEPDANVIVANYQSWVDQARKHLSDPELTIVINRQTPGGQRVAIRQSLWQSLSARSRL